MNKILAASIITVLVIGSSAVGQIDLQFQGWNFGLTNSITMSGGPGEAGTVQGIGTLSVQNLGINPGIGGTDPAATAWQGIGLALFQTGNVITGGAPVGLVQSLTVQGLGLTVNGLALPAGQTQMIGDLSGPTLQYQGTSVAGAQTLTKGRGSDAEVEGLNLTAFGMAQAGGNNCADGNQSSLIVGGQHSTLSGAAQSVGSVQTGMTATVQQFQTANNY